MDQETLSNFIKASEKCECYLLDWMCCLNGFTTRYLVLHEGKELVIEEIPLNRGLTEKQFLEELCESQGKLKRQLQRANPEVLNASCQLLGIAEFKIWKNSPEPVIGCTAHEVASIVLDHMDGIADNLKDSFVRPQTSEDMSELLLRDEAMDDVERLKLISRMRIERALVNKYAGSDSIQPPRPSKPRPPSEWCKLLSDNPSIPISLDTFSRMRRNGDVTELPGGTTRKVILDLNSTEKYGFPED